MINKVILMGNLGKDPELKNLPTGSQYCKFSLATNESYTDKSGQKQNKTEWHNVVVWGKSAENCAKYLAKGSKALVEGKLTHRSYDKDGKTVYFTEVSANNVQFMGSKKDDRAQLGAPVKPTQQYTTDEIPF